MRQLTSPILDVLAIDGGWMQRISLMHVCEDRFGIASSTVYRSLFRWKAMGQVESRVRNGRSEWRATNT